MLLILHRVSWFSVGVDKVIKRTMCSKSKKPFTILVEGNIGSGKTTFLNNFIHNKNIFTLCEPIEDWKNLGGHDLMTQFYKNRKNWAFPFQSYVLLTMMQAHLKETNRPVKMMERSIYSGRYVFIENLYRMNFLSKPEVAVLDEWFNWLIEKWTVSVDLIVYLKTDPEVAYQRIIKRSRKGENNFNFDYINELHECHENWLSSKSSIMCPAPVLFINANKDIESVKHAYEHFKSQMKL